ncbi:MAG: ExbD/TolR family protein [Myxococcota bacterium]|nr:hypothetical protein [Myxococcota bacterium]
MRTRSRTALSSFLFAASSFACAPSLHKPAAGDHYRGTAATATQTGRGIDDDRLVFDLEVRQVNPDGSFDALLTFTDARILDDGATQNAESLIGKSVTASFEATGRLQQFAVDGLDDRLTGLVTRTLSALQATGPVSPLDLRTIRNDRPRQASLSTSEGTPVIATFRSEGTQRTPKGPFNVVGVSGEQNADIKIEDTRNVKAQVRVSGKAQASMRDLLIGETRVGSTIEYLDDSSDARSAAAEAKPVVSRRSESLVVIAQPEAGEAPPDLGQIGGGEGLFGCSDHVSALTNRIQTMTPLYSAADTSVPQVAGELVQYGQESGPRVVVGPEGTYVVDSNGTRGAALDRDQLGQALAQAMPQAEQVIVYIDADQSVQARQLLDIAATLREMTQMLEVRLEGRLLVGARTIKLPGTVSHPRLRQEAADLEGAAPSLRVGLVPQIFREELGRTCYAGYRASAESFAAGVSLGTARRAIPSLIATCGCQGVDMQFLDGYLGLFDARVLGSGWIPLPQTTGSGKQLRLARRATVGELVGQIEQMGVSPNDIGHLKIVVR